jgi:hypothetical protein
MISTEMGVFQISFIISAENISKRTPARWFLFIFAQTPAAFFSTVISVGSKHGRLAHEFLIDDNVSKRLPIDSLGILLH